MSVETIFVVGFASKGGVGGFEWRFAEVNAENERDEMLSWGDADVTDVREVELIDLGLTPDAPSSAITAALDENPHLWEPSVTIEDRLTEALHMIDEAENGVAAMDPAYILARLSDVRGVVGEALSIARQVS